MVTETERLFIALTPPNRVRQSLARLRDTLLRERGGRGMVTDNLHLTLAFLGVTPSHRIPELLTLLASLPPAIFSLTLDCYGSFKANSPKGSIVWAGCQTPPELAALVDTLWQRLSDAGFAFDAKHFVPHVTLLRDASPDAGPCKAIVWPAGAPVLFRTEATAKGPRYHVIPGLAAAGKDAAMPLSPLDPDR
ncbi:RNA 2',3'-cyclic phosphodiesterase [Chitinolyticbacter albus]|uniref:RNA 2',3'-cyclic phosphodiesterase n=1 Tax=Chitinolyticbacter albus TaxID=2961951 RepID=UPI00210DE878|nr:RNA 2',3'-cyclic phosphodiesterase [Chitinolyticbacter albus]